MEQMEYRLNLSGCKRKEAADCVGAALGIPVVYRKAPTYAYAVGKVEIDREAILHFTEGISEVERRAVLSSLQTAGFLPELAEEAKANLASSTSPHEPNRLTIQIPLEGFSPEKLDNLSKLVASKAINRDRRRF